MTGDRIKALQARTDAKMRFAAVHLDEMSAHGNPDGGDFDRAHQESFLFHLLGTRDAFLAELNAYYGAALPDDNLTPGKLHDALALKDLKCPELSALYELEHDDSTWYATAKAMRDHSSHVSDVSRAYFLGGADHRKVKLRHPQSRELIDEHFPDTFQRWLGSMRTLIQELRRSALTQTQLPTEKFHAL